MKNNDLIDLLKYAAMAGNVLYVLWILYNGIDEGFSAPLVQKVAYLGMIVLLILNTVLLSRKVN